MVGNKITRIVVVTAVVILTALAVTAIYKDKLSNVVSNYYKVSIPEKEVVSEKTDYSKEYISLRGKLKKEKIADELDLGDYWYWLYLNEELLLELNSTGAGPVYVSKIQVIPPHVENKETSLDTFLNSDVEIYGYLTWGYAESRAFQAESISKKD